MQVGHVGIALIAAYRGKPPAFWPAVINAVWTHMSPFSAKNEELIIFRRTGTYLKCGVRIVALQRGATIRPLYST